MRTSLQVLLLADKRKGEQKMWDVEEVTQELKKDRKEKEK